MTNNYQASSTYLDKIQWLVSVGIFLSNRIEGLIVLFSAILLCSHYNRIFKSKILPYFLLISTTSLFSIIYNNYDADKYFQQILLIALFFFSYEQFFFYNKKNILPLFVKYLKISYYICCIGIIQELFYFFTHINISESLPFYHSTQPINSFLIRISSILPEGGYLGTILIPTLVYAFYYNDKLNVLGLKKYIIMVVSLLTFSPFVYLILFIIFVKKLFSRYKFVKYVLFLSIVYILSIGGFVLADETSPKEKSGIQGVIMRISDSLAMGRILFENNIDQIAELNTSNAVWASNLYVALYAPSRFLGTGLGTNAQSHAKLIGESFNDERSFSTLNLEDGYSLSNRLLSELGVFGFFLYLLFVYRSFNKANFMNVCMLSIIICWFLRGGSYVNFGTVFVHYFYYYTSKKTICL